MAGDGESRGDDWRERARMDAYRRTNDSLRIERSRSPRPQPTPARIRSPFSFDRVSAGSVAPAGPSAMLNPPGSFQHPREQVMYQIRQLSQQNLARGQEIANRCQQIHELKGELADKDAKIQRFQEHLGKKTNQSNDFEKQMKHAKIDCEMAERELLQHKESSNRAAEDKEDMLHAGRKAMLELLQKATHLAEENNSLRATISERDGTISTLKEHAAQLSVSSKDERVTMAVESQTQSMLAKVQGLESELTDCHTAIDGSRAVADALAAEKEASEADNKRLKDKLAITEEALRLASKSATDTKAVNEDQAKLIQRLMGN